MPLKFGRVCKRQKSDPQSGIVQRQVVGSLLVCRLSMRTWTDAALKEAVSVSESLAEVLRVLNLAPAGGNYQSLWRHIERLGLDTHRFKEGRKRRLALLSSCGFQATLKPEKIFCKDSPVQSSKLSKKLRKLGLIPYQCSLCGNPGQHNGLDLVLQVDHLNGYRRDNRVSNLRFLCPNCHSQTHTFAGRNNRRKRETRTPTRKVPYETLHQRYQAVSNYRKVAKEFGVSDVTVRNAVRKLSNSPIVQGQDPRL